MMTKEEKIQQMLDDWVSVKICEKAMINDINEIYDNFESRTCENCQLCDGVYCADERVKYIFGGHPVPKDYGCNYWEAKS